MICNWWLNKLISENWMIMPALNFAKDFTIFDHWFNIIEEHKCYNMNFFPDPATLVFLAQETS